MTYFSAEDCDSVCCRFFVLVFQRVAEADVADPVHARVKQRSQFFFLRESKAIFCLRCSNSNCSVIISSALILRTVAIRYAVLALVATVSVNSWKLKITVLIIAIANSSSPLK